MSHYNVNHSIAVNSGDCDNCKNHTEVGWALCKCGTWHSWCRSCWDSNE